MNGKAKFSSNVNSQFAGRPQQKGQEAGGPLPDASGPDEGRGQVPRQDQGG